MLSVLGLVAILLVLSARAFARRPDVVRDHGRSLRRCVVPATFDRVPDEFSRWETRMVRMESGPLDTDLFLAFDVRGRIPVTARTHVVVVATAFDVDASGRRIPLRSHDPEARDPRSLVFTDVLDLGAVEPGEGFTHWAPAIGLRPALLMAPAEGRRRYRVVLAAHDAESPFPNGCLCRTAHEFEWVHRESGSEA